MVKIKSAILTRFFSLIIPDLVKVSIAVKKHHD